MLLFVSRRAERVDEDYSAVVKANLSKAGCHAVHYSLYSDILKFKTFKALLSSDNEKVFRLRSAPDFNNVAGERKG